MRRYGLVFEIRYWWARVRCYFYSYRYTWCHRVRKHPKLELIPESGLWGCPFCGAIGGDELVRL